MHISSFDDLLAAARAQPEPQRLLFVFTAAELADDASPEQRLRFEAGEGGSLVPVMAVDRATEVLDDFDALVEEADQFGRPWVIVFVAAMDGRAAEDAVGLALEAMMEAVRQGKFSACIPFDRHGLPVAFD